MKEVKGEGVQRSRSSKVKEFAKVSQLREGSKSSAKYPAHHLMTAPMCRGMQVFVFVKPLAGV